MKYSFERTTVVPYAQAEKTETADKEEIGIYGRFWFDLLSSY